MRTNQPRGNDHYKTKLTEIKVRRIKLSLEINTSYKFMCELASVYGVSYNCIYDIHHKRTWQHVEI